MRLMELVGIACAIGWVALHVFVVGYLHGYKAATGTRVPVVAELPPPQPEPYDVQPSADSVHVYSVYAGPSLPTAAMDAANVIGGEAWKNADVLLRPQPQGTIVFPKGPCPQ